MTTDAQVSDRTRAVLDSTDDEWVVLALPHTDYRLRLRRGGDVNTPVGKRIRGVIEATALRIHPAAGGGRFVEPVSGEPRIVAGVVRAVDTDAGRVLVDVAAPMWLSFDEGQDASVIRPGEMVNCYVRDAAFTPDPA